MALLTTPRVWTALCAAPVSPFTPAYAKEHAAEEKEHAAEGEEDEDEQGEEDADDPEHEEDQDGDAAAQEEEEQVPPLGHAQPLVRRAAWGLLGSLLPLLPGLAQESQQHKAPEQHKSFEQHESHQQHKSHQQHEAKSQQQHKKLLALLARAVLHSAFIERDARVQAGMWGVLARFLRGAFLLLPAIRVSSTTRTPRFFYSLKFACSFLTDRVFCSFLTRVCSWMPF